jgi:hypothetical protein
MKRGNALQIYIAGGYMGSWWSWREEQMPATMAVGV